MNNSLISVIVPIYNVEDYLSKCIDSIINQTYKNLEIILVDDGSTDKSSIICDEYKKKDSRIKVIHKNNDGLSSARNAGLDIAKGSLIGFVDSDDYIEETMYEELKNNMDYYNSDIAVCEYYRVFGNKRTTRSIASSEILLLKEKEKFESLQYKKNSIDTCAWNKLYKKELFDNIRYPNGQIYEDSYIICDLLEKANIVSYLNKPLYNYVYRSESIINNSKSNHLDQIKSFNKKIEFYNMHEYNDLVINEKNKKICAIINKIIILSLNSGDNQIIISKFYDVLTLACEDIKWKDADSITKKYKIMKKFYIKYRIMRSLLKYSLKNTIKKYTSF